MPKEKQRELTAISMKTGIGYSDRTNITVAILGGSDTYVNGDKELHRSASRTTAIPDTVIKQAMAATGGNSTSLPDLESAAS